MMCGQKEDIKGYVEYLKDEYELSDEDCKLYNMTLKQFTIMSI